ncbi:MAG: hypothetical protein WC421_02210 [Elusimicrobiales bacterium]
MKRGIAFKTALLLFAAALFLPGRRWQAAADAAALLALASRDAGALRAGSFRFWFFPAALAAAVSFFSADADASLLGYGYSSRQMAAGAVMMFHAYVFAALARFGRRNFTMGEIVSAADRAGAGGAGLRAALALASARILKRMLAETWLHYCVSRPGKKERLLDMDIFFGAAVRNAASAAENISVLLHIRNVDI